MVDGSVRLEECERPVDLAERGGTALSRADVREVRAYWAGDLAAVMTPAEALERPCHVRH